MMIFLGDKEIASFDEKINDDAYKTDPVARWKAFLQMRPSPDSLEYK